jgi:hypothetical protein
MRHLRRRELSSGKSGPSKAEFVAKIGAAVEEADEAILWVGVDDGIGKSSMGEGSGITEGSERRDSEFFGIAANRKTCSMSDQSHNCPITQSLNFYEIF